MRFKTTTAFLCVALWATLTKASSAYSQNNQTLLFAHEDNGFTETTTSQVDEMLPEVPSFKVKRVDHYFSQQSKAWKYRDMGPEVTLEGIPVLQKGSHDPWRDYSFVVVRKIPQQEGQDPTFKVVIKSGYIVKICQDVIKSWPGISWNAEPLELDPEIFITLFDKFVEYRDQLAAKEKKTQQEGYLLSSANLILTTISTDYRTTLARLDQLKAHNEISFDLLYSILLPRTIFVATCGVTGNPRLFQLNSYTRNSLRGASVYQLHGESYDLVDDVSQRKVAVGKVQTTILLHSLKGTVKITDLDAYPINYYSDPEGLRAALLQRGKKWIAMAGIHHVHYSGTAASRRRNQIMKHNVNGRIMVDRAAFRRLNSRYQFPKPYTATPPCHTCGINFDDGPREVFHSFSTDDHQYIEPLDMSESQAAYHWAFGSPYANGTPSQTAMNTDPSNEDLSDHQLILTSSVVYGFSLSDKLWLEFDVEKVQPVEWNEEAFNNLVLPASRKDLLRSLVDAHHQDLGFDDFIKGKGQGLVINLFGPPGVGKTFSAEATSEHVKRPLYAVGGGDLGTTAVELDESLERIFDVATAWKAIVLIDEADVFLEQRSLHALERNAMVAVFLRHLEYYRGILFLTTNRVQAFDESFLSRIHVALHLPELSQESKKQVWSAFIKKLTASHTITVDQITELAKRDVNGRQIKNAVRTAQSLAVGHGEVLEYRHFVEALDAMSEFTKEFIASRKGSGQ